MISPDLASDPRGRDRFEREARVISTLTHQSGREFAKSQLVLADGKLVVLDQDGVRALASPSPKGPRVHSRVSLLQSLAWTPPTLVGTRLYVRDRKSLMALDLGQ